MSSDGAFAAAACDRGGGGRRGCRDSPAPATQRPDRARPGRRKTVLHGLSARTGRGFSQPPAGARPRRAGGRDRHARGARLAPAQAPARPPRGAAAARRRRRGSGNLPAARGHGPPDPRLDAPALARRGAVHTGLAGLGGRRGQGRRHRRRDGRRRRAGRGRARAQVPAQLVGAGRRARDRLRGRDHLALPDRDRPGLQQVRQAEAGPAAQRRARAGRPGRGGRGRGLPDRREPPDQRGERVRDRPRPQQAGGPLRQPDRRVPARRGARGGGPRARPPEAQRPAARARVARAGGARRDVPHAGARRALCAPRAGHAGRAAGDRAGRGAGGARPRDSVERPVEAGGGQGRLVCPRADARPRPIS